MVTIGKLLILDDEVAIATTVARIAETVGFETRMTTVPAEFFGLLDEWQPSHIALDLVMPEMDGVQVMVNLANRACRARIIITSGVGNRVLDAAGRSAAEHGLDIAGVLPKPFSPAALRKLLLDTDARLDSGTGAHKFATPPRDIQLAPAHLRQALAERQLFLAFQPQIACETGALAGVEALVRWAHPELGTIMPDRFIPMAESAGLIDDLTDQVLDLGLAWLSKVFPGGDDSNNGDVTLSVNISASTLGARDFVQHALRACRKYEIDAARLILELTETSAMRDPIASLDQLTRMRMKGFQLSIDDFGTGFSSMLQLARLPFSELKVDKSFVMTAMQSMESRAVVRSIVDLGRSLGLRTVAEGVEDGATLEFLKSLNCDVAQGYFIARPMPGEAVAEWAARHAAGVAAPLLHPAKHPAPERVEAFRWDNSFITGLENIDRQHEQLVALINRLGSSLLKDVTVSRTDLDALFAELRDYATNHFREEEEMMAELEFDPRHLKFHRAEHAAFLAEVMQLQQGISHDSPEALQPVLSFLVHWLAYHILGVDQSMSRQVVAIREGKSPVMAFRAEIDRVEGSTEPLVKALKGLFNLVSQRNRELRHANRMLESRIAERTTALSQANRRLAEIAMTDVLTGIPNRRHAMVMLARAWSASARNGDRLACLMIDADHLKAINDQHGHDVGDELLRLLASCLSDAVRTDDIVCRMGGDEFLVIGPATSLEGALQLADKIRQEVGKLRIPAGDGYWEGSVSIGVAMRDDSMDDWEDLIKAADEAVYAAKQAGRNLVATRDGPVRPSQVGPA